MLVLVLVLLLLLLQLVVLEGGAIPPPIQKHFSQMSPQIPLGSVWTSPVGGGGTLPLLGGGGSGGGRTPKRQRTSFFVSLTAQKKLAGFNPEDSECPGVLAQAGRTPAPEPAPLKVGGGVRPPASYRTLFPPLLFDHPCPQEVGSTDDVGPASDPRHIVQ